ncbi:Golgi-associated plant pathogenesis-related protein 1-like [Drosophila ficusphila]|uniref:Golgi-associated plant pathogenesis-related protein 1-like n=1 Tax=Drosophila ficusphila TaxID=30025 RepID=UPI0007E6B63F|nr:Golgi-associated plant pathogenesis-related protein 1-like [Drosophila ficusphila]
MALVNTLLVLAFCWLLVVDASPKSKALDRHNELREKHGCPALELDDELTRDCENYARELRSMGEIKPSRDAIREVYGENLCYRDEDPHKCVQDWYDEIKDYDFSKPGYDAKTAHFTALVWKKAKKMGFGQAKDEKGGFYVVVRYLPRVNAYGEFKKNVPKPKDGNNSNLPQVDAILVILAFCLHFRI